MAFPIFSYRTIILDMYQKSDKRFLYYIIDLYLRGEIDESTFCDELYYSYVLEIDESTLTSVENKIFSELEAITSRFSEFEEDYQMDSKAFATKDEVRKEINRVKEILLDN